MAALQVLHGVYVAILCSPNLPSGSAGYCFVWYVSGTTVPLHLPPAQEIWGCTAPRRPEPGFPELSELGSPLAGAYDGFQAHGYGVLDNLLILMHVSQGP